MGFFRSRKQKSTPKPSPSTSQPQSQAQATNTYTTHHANLSTTSTLVSQDPSPSRPEPQRTNSYEAFLSHARESESRRVRKLEKEERVLREWISSQEARINGRGGEGRSRNWPADPWRGGFGPSLNDRDGRGVRGWLGSNGLVRK